MSVYFITARALGQVKIGASDKPYLRLKALQTGSPVPLALERLIDGGVEDERALHGRFSGLRLSGEWFQLAEEMEAFMATLAEPPPPERQRFVMPNDDLGNLSLDAYMIAYRVSGRDLAARVGISEASLTRIRQGRQNIARDLIRRIVLETDGIVTAHALVFAGDHADPFTDAALAPATGQNGELSGGVAL